MSRAQIDAAFASRPHLDKVREKLYTHRDQGGKQVGIRLDIPSARRGIEVVTIHEKPAGGRVIGYDHSTVITDCTFIVQPGGAKSVGAEGGNKFPFAFVGGTLRSSAEEVQIEDATPTAVFYNPRKVHLFVDAMTMQPLKGAEVVIMLGRETYALGPVYYEPWETPAAPEGMDSAVGDPQRSPAV